MTNRKAIRRATSTILMQQLEPRQMMSASSTKVIDTTGPIDQMVEVNGQIVVSSAYRSGGGTTEIWIGDGDVSHTRKLLDTESDATDISSIDNLTATDDGRVFFTASATGGRQLFQIDLQTGDYVQVSSGSGVFYSQLVAAGNRLFAYDSTNDNLYRVDRGQSIQRVGNYDISSEFFTAGTTAFWVSNNKLFRSDGTAAGTLAVSGDYYVSGPSKVFTSNDHAYIETRNLSDSSETVLVRFGLTGSMQQVVAQDFSISSNVVAEVDGWTYFSGGFYNTSPNASGREMYRVRTSDGTLEPATQLVQTNGGGAVSNITAIGTSVYFTATDGDYLTGQGIYDVELFKYNTSTRQTTLVTTGNTQFPVEQGRGALGYYYFVAAPDKANARYGNRELYRTNPATNAIELVSGVPTVLTGNAVPNKVIEQFAVGSRGLFFTANSGDYHADSDVFFSTTPFSIVDPVKRTLTLQATDTADDVTMRVDGSDLVIALNGIEERHALSTFGRIEAYLKAGNDSFVAEATVTTPMYVFGDVGNDSMTGGSGMDTLMGGAGKNSMHGGAGNDRINGSGGRDYAYGGDGDDRIYGNAGDDFLNGDGGIDRIWGGEGNDDIKGGSSNDKLFGETGNDTLNGGRHNDWMLGGEGDDVIYGNDGADTLDGGNGSDIFWCGVGIQNVLSNDGQSDTINDSESDDLLTKDLIDVLA